MRELFVDSIYYVALINPHDQHHRRALLEARTVSNCRFCTTHFVLAEVLALLRGIDTRRQAAQYVREILAADDTTVVEMTQELWASAFRRYERFRDKEWSFTDCLSFEVMAARNITEALTADHHFEQAQFTALLRR